MSMQTQPPETDLIVPLPGEDEHWDPWTIHTHYFGASVPEAELGVFTYIRYMPAFPACQGGVCIFRGLDNFEPVDMEFCDYKITMPWPKVDGNVIETENGLRIEFLEPVDISLAEEEIVDRIFTNQSRWRACNDAMARLYNVSAPTVIATAGPTATIGVT